MFISSPKSLKGLGGDCMCGTREGKVDEQNTTSLD
jgi:hypothetical protein